MTAREEIQALQNQAADSARQVQSLSHELETERNRRINEMHEAKGRLQHLFDSELAPRLRGAREALHGGPLAVDVALERLDRTSNSSRRNDRGRLWTRLRDHEQPSRVH